MKYVRLALLVMLLFCLAAGLMQPGAYHKTVYLMDTLCTVTVYGSNAEAATNAVFARLHEIDKKCNAHQPESDLSRLNDAPSGIPVPLDDELYFLLQQSLDFGRLSGGHFDVTLLPVSKLWGFGAEIPKLPAREAIENALSKTGTDKLIVDDTQKTVTKLTDGVCFDLGAVVKGYAADEAVRILQQHGVEHAFLDLGGNIAVMGGKPQSFLQRLLGGKKTTDFAIGVQKPDAVRGTVAETVFLSDGFVVTSGSYERFFEENGKRFHHILDPKTGYPAESGFQSVTIVSKSGLTADMASTALFVAGKEELPAVYALCDEIISIDDAGALQYVKRGDDHE
ncbi:MAG: FAD:protein FMN transferase [Ruminococcaceae bacterium]|nr:FAD:protein FMN transferase [Oscillospiraceae bacterium]